MISSPVHPTSFQQLRTAAGIYPNAMDFSMMHGFLTGVAMGPDEVHEQPWLPLALGLPDDAVAPDEIIGLVMQVFEEVVEDLIEGAFEPQAATEQRGGDTLPRMDLWCQGFVQACALANEGWEDMTNDDLDLGKLLLIINIIADPERYGPLLFSNDVSFTDAGFLAEIRGITGAVISKMASRVFEIEGLFEEEDGFAGQDVEFDFTEDDLREIPEQGLMLFILTMGDRLPRVVVDECVRRGAGMLPLLAGYLDDDQNWGPDVAGNQWWALLHCIFILGAIDDPRAAAPLLEIFKRMRDLPDDDLWDWVAAYWPALFRNKRKAAAPALRRIAEDRTLGWYPRSRATECVLEAAAASGNEALEAALDWVAVIAADETEDDDTRCWMGMALLNFPRERHRLLLESLVDLQQQQAGLLYMTFDMGEIAHAFQTGDAPEWERFPDPWSFYDPEAIAQRQRRWAEEDIAGEDSFLFDDDEFMPVETYVREQPKVGRNDPCPCGSGKKYKKCCLH
jgi:yecA family protein